MCNCPNCQIFFCCHSIRHIYWQRLDAQRWMFFFGWVKPCHVGKYSQQYRFISTYLFGVIECKLCKCSGMCTLLHILFELEFFSGYLLLHGMDLQILWLPAKEREWEKKTLQKCPRPPHLCDKWLHLILWTCSKLCNTCAHFTLLALLQKCVNTKLGASAGSIDHHLHILDIFSNY